MTEKASEGRRRAALLGISAAVAWLLYTPDVHAGSIIVEAYDTGWYRSDGFHDPMNNNYLAQASFSCGRFCFTPSYRNFFAFDLASKEGRIVASANFEVQRFDVSSSGAYALYDVSTPANELTAGGSNLTSIHNDLGSGASYGSTSNLQQAGSSLSLITVNLNSNAVTAINATNGNFAIGGSISSGFLFSNSFGNNFSCNSFGCGGSNPPQRLVLNTIDPVFSVSGGSFGNVLVGNSGTSAVTVSNTGQAGTYLRGFLVNPASGGEFSGSAGIPGQLVDYGPVNPGSPVSFTFGYAPQGRGADSHGLYVQDQLSGRTVTLSGTGVAPVSSVASVAAPVVARVGTTAVAGLSVTNVGDGNRATGGLSSTVSNLNGMASVVPGGSFGLASGGAFSLADGGSTSIGYAFSPVERGTSAGTAQVTFTNGSADGRNLTHSAQRTLQGIGVGPDLRLSQSAIDFGPVLAGMQSIGLVDLTNASTDAGYAASLAGLTIRDIIISGADAGLFSLTNAGSLVGSVLMPSMLASLDLRYAPGSSLPGSHSATLTIVTDQGATFGGSGRQFTTSLSGSTYAPVVAAVPEPGTLLLLSSGLLGVGLAARRKPARRKVA